MAEQKGPLLNLKMEKGPLSGQDLQFKPGKQIQIGRVVRGNTISIKDSGISSKHLSITFDESGSGSWAITDLGSSNGTFLNTLLIDPSRPVKLSHGDVIKMGELTSIKVEIGPMGVELVEEVDAKSKNTRRNPRRKAGVNEDCELGFGKGGVENVVSKRTTRSSKSVKTEDFSAVEVPMRTRGAREVKNVVDSVEDIENPAVIEVEREKKPSPRRTRGSRKVESVKDGNNTVEEAGNLAVVDADLKGKPSTRRTRGAKKVESVKNGDGLEVTENLPVVDEEGERKLSPRRTRGGRKAKNVNAGVGNVEEAKSFAALDVEKEKNVCSRRTRGSKKEEDVENPGENLGECIELGKGKGNRRTKRRVCVEENGVMENLERDQEAVENNADEEVERNVPEELADKSGREGCEASTSNTGINMNVVQVEEEVDLEKMTLGEWLDCLEVALPKQIIDATDEMILAMNQKSERFQEFMKQQKNAMGSDGIPKG